MKRNIQVLLVIASLITYPLQAGHLGLTGAIVAAGGAVAAGIKFHEEYSQARGLRGSINAAPGAITSAINSLSNRVISPSPEEEAEQRLDNLKQFANRYKKSIAWGTLAATLAVTSLHLATRK